MRLIMNKILLYACLLTIFFFSNSFYGQTNIWEKEIMVFERCDSLNSPESGGIVFVGSSSIRGWRTLSNDFPNQNVLNRGFGGSELGDVIYFFDRIVAKYKPKQIILYAGDNDISSGKSPDAVFEKFKEFYRKMKVELPGSELLFLSIKPSIARWEMYTEMQKVNCMVENFASNRKKVGFIDISTDMLGDDGKPKPEFFLEDGLHMSKEGYEFWKEKVEPYLEH